LTGISRPPVSESESMERTFVIGDIHGCIDKFQCLLGKLPLDWSRDRMIVLGDFIDRGPAPRRVMELLMEMKLEHGERLIVLMGNHERMFLDYLADRDANILFPVVGGQSTIDDFTEPDGRLVVPEMHLRFLQSLPVMEVDDRFCFVHAGLRPKRAIEDQDEHDLLFIRSEFIDSGYDWGRRVIFGHTPFEHPLIQENKIGIDTGAVYGGRLTALVLPEIDFIFA